MDATWGQDGATLSVLEATRAQHRVLQLEPSGVGDTIAGHGGHKCCNRQIARAGDNDTRCWKRGDRVLEPADVDDATAETACWEAVAGRCWNRRCRCCIRPCRLLEPVVVDAGTGRSRHYEPARVGAASSEGFGAGTAATSREMLEPASAGAATHHGRSCNRGSTKDARRSEERRVGKECSW